MTKAAVKRMIDAIQSNDLDGVRRALEQGARPDASYDGVAIPAFALFVRDRRDPPRSNTGAMLRLFLEHGLDPNLRFNGRRGRPQPIVLGTPLLHSAINSLPPDLEDRTGEAWIAQLLDAGADPLQEESAELRRNAWHLGAHQQHLGVLDLLDRATDPAWDVPGDRLHPLEQAFERRRFQHSRDRDDAHAIVVAQRVLQRFPHALEHRFQGATVTMRWQRNGTGSLPAMAWALDQGAAWQDRWPLAQQTLFDPETRPVLAANRPFTVWPTVVRLARAEGVAHPLVQRALQDPVMLERLNEPFWMRDVQEYAAGDQSSTPLSLALHEDAHHLNPIEQRHQAELVDALVARGARADHEIDPDRVTPGQRWVIDMDNGPVALLDRYPGWEAPHRVSGRTPLFEATTPNAARFCLQRGQRLDQVAANGDQAFVTLVARGITEDKPDLFRWCVEQLAAGHAPLDGVAQGRSLADWAGARVDLFKAFERARSRSPEPQVASTQARESTSTDVGDRALHAAVDRLSMTQVRKLLDRGADVNVVDGDGLTPLLRLMMAPAKSSTLRQRRLNILTDLAGAGARGDAVGTGRFDLYPDRAKRSTSSSNFGEIEPGFLVTLTGSALHHLASRVFDGDDETGPLRRYALVRTLLNMPGALAPAAWSARCSDLVALTLLDACQPEDLVADQPPALDAMWTALDLDRLSDTQRDDVLMALLDPGRVLSTERGNGNHLRTVEQRFRRSSAVLDGAVQRLIDRGATAFVADGSGRALVMAMADWAQGTHARNRLARPHDLTTPATVNSTFQAHMSVWGRWVQVALETEALRATWEQAVATDPLSPAHEVPPVASNRRRL